jgi:hypothetical protein
MLDLLSKPETETAIDTAPKRARIEQELRADPTRSDREIARIVGCDHKTVGAARERLGVASPVGNSAAPMFAGLCPPPPGVVDEPAEENHFLPECEDLVIPSQPAIAVYTNRYDQIVIRQEASAYDDEDKFIYVCPQHLDALIVRLRKYLP